MKQYRVTSPRLGIDHGAWSGESPAHALVAMLRSQGFDAQVYLRVTQQPLWCDEHEGESGRYGVSIHHQDEARLARLGLSYRNFKVEELQPLPMELFA